MSQLKTGDRISEYVLDEQVGSGSFGQVWKAAFAYYDPADRLDFSDTGELMHILGLGENGIEAFRKRFLGN